MPRDFGPSKLPRIDLPWDTVRRNYGGQAYEIIEKLRSTKTGQKDAPPESFKWTVEWERADDPNTDNPEMFAKYLALNSKIWLVARGNKLKAWTDLSVTPPQLMSRFEERARMICEQRRNEEAVPDEPTPLYEPDYKADRLIHCLQEWLSRHPKANKALATIATVAIEQLVASGDKQ